MALNDSIVDIKLFSHLNVEDKIRLVDIDAQLIRKGLQKVRTEQYIDLG